MKKNAIWWCVQSPKGALLDWSVDALREMAILRFCSNVEVDVNSYRTHRDNTPAGWSRGHYRMWNQYRRKGFRCVKIEAREVEQA